MLEKISTWSVGRLFWTTVLGSFLILDAASWILYSAPSACLVSAIDHQSPNGPKQYCPTFDVWLLQFLKLLYQQFDAGDFAFIFAAMIVAALLWQVIARFTGTTGPVTWFFKIERLEKLTVALAVIGFFQFLVFAKTDRTLNLQQRAWLAPVGAEIVPPFQEGRSIHFIVKLINSGREPAKNLNSLISNWTIDPFETSANDMAITKVPLNTTCDGLETAKGRFSIPPTTGAAIVNETFDTNYGEPKLVLDSDIIQGNKFYGVTGCLAYDSFEAPHHSGFCFVLESSAFSFQRPLPTAPGAGPGGGPTGPPNPTVATNGRNFTFVTCGSGFSLD